MKFDSAFQPRLSTCADTRGVHTSRLISAGSPPRWPGADDPRPRMRPSLQSLGNLVVYGAGRVTPTRQAEGSLLAHLGASRGECPAPPGSAADDELEGDAYGVLEAALQTP